ncbi:MAG: TetR/AcrR family transcriptional regulator [Cystobacterineae bacterium]|nr:TetR/AcrR family transcriptional regulator [Cystobacterineae bacterium]
MKRAEHKERTRQALLAAAGKTMAAQGFAATRAREVAKAAGVAVGTVFAHFPTMASLAEALLDELVGEALARAGEGPPGNLIEQLLHVSAALYEAYMAAPELSREVVSGSLFEAAPGGPSRRRMAEFSAWVGARVEAAVAAGHIEPIHPQDAFLAYFALYFGVLVLGLRGELDVAGQITLLERQLRRAFRPAVRP